MNEKIPVQTIEEILTRWRAPPKRVLFVVREESDLKFNVVDAWRNYICEKHGSSFGSVSSDFPKDHFIHQYLAAPGWHMNDPSSGGFFPQEAREEARVDRLVNYLRLRGRAVDGRGYDRVIAYRTLYEQLEQKLSSSGVSVVHSNLTSFFKATEILHHTEPSTSVWESNDPTALEHTLFGSTSRASVKDYIVRKFQEKFDTAVYLGGGCFCCSVVYDSEPTLDLFSEIFGNRIIVASSSRNFEGCVGKVDSSTYNQYLNLGRGYGKKVKYLPTLIGI